MLTSEGPGSSEWQLMVYSVPGWGPEANLGEYSFQVTTPMPAAGDSSAPPESAPPAQTGASSSPAATSPPVAASSPAGDVTTSGHFTVVTAAEPSVSLSEVTSLRKASLPEGGQLEIWLSGFPSFSMVYVSLYGPGGPTTYPLLTDLPGVHTDQNGEGVVRWTIPAGTAVGTYAIWIYPPPSGCKSACFTFQVIP
jgi:hypothetical protein